MNLNGGRFEVRTEELFRKRLLGGGTQKRMAYMSSSRNLGN